MNYYDVTTNIVDELKNNLRNVDDKQIDDVTNQIINANRIFFAGAGRSGLMIKTFAMRLMHMGLNCYVVSEIVTPSIQKGDLLIIASGSGETASLVSMATKAKKIGANVSLFTIHSDSSIGKIADNYVVIPGVTFKSDKDDTTSSIQPMGSLFEQSLFFVFESIVIMLMNKLNKKNEDMIGLHANLE